MKRNMNKYIRRLKARKKMQRQLGALIAALSVVVSSTVTWQLHGTGSALNDSDISPDDLRFAAESIRNGSSEADWEKELPDTGGLSVAESAAVIAESQIGYEEEKLSFSSGEISNEDLCCTRYGNWYGNPYGEWNTIFTYFCMKYAGVDEKDIPYGSGCWAWTLELDKRGLAVPAGNGPPKRGDVVFIDSDLDGKPDRSGIVTGSEGDEVITVVEGNVEGKVAKTEYQTGDERITGFLPLDDTVSGEKTDEEDISGKSGKKVFTSVSEAGVRVAAYADEGTFPDGTEMKVLDISSEEIIDSAAESLNAEAYDIDAVAVDISFIAPDGTEIEPADDTSVRVQMILPDELRLERGEYALLHMDDSGGMTSVDNAELSNIGAEFTAESFSIYVVTSSGINLSNTVVLEDGKTGTNSESNPYILRVREKLTVLYKGEYKEKGVFTVFPLNQGYISRADYGPDDKDFVEETYRRAEFVGSSVGTCRIAMLKSKNWTESNIAESFWVKVVDDSYVDKNVDIYLNTALGERHIDNLHECLSSLHGGSPDEYFVLDENGNKKYIKNRDTFINGRDDDGFGPYRVSMGDVFEVVSYCKPQEKDSLSFKEASEGSHNDTGILDKLSEKKELIESGEHAGEYRISAEFKVKKGNKARTGIKIGNSYFYILSAEDDKIMSHADIEIDDGGTYVVEKYSFKENGTIEKTITKYSAMVSEINHCKIYQQNGEPVLFSESKAKDKSHENQPVVFVSDDYIKNNVQGQSQYELTSNYVPESKKDQESDEMGLRGNKNFLLMDSYRADFNVDLRLFPDSEVVETYDNTGKLIGSVNNPVGKNAIEKEKLDFTLGRQAILDAYNKCPVHTGLDFTLAANAVMVDFEMKKELVGDTYNAGDFEFELRDGDNVIATASNDANGIVKFENIYFNKAGSFKYTVHEVSKEPSKFNYANDREVTFNVTEKEGILAAEVELGGVIEPLVNYRTYKLPDTGGCGVIPYIAAGTAIVSTAVLLLIFTRRKEML